MRKRRQGRTLSRSTTQRTALKRTMLVSLINFSSIKTTLAKAKELKPFAEKMVTKAKKATDKNNSGMIIRQLKKDLPKASAKKLIELAVGYQKRKGGYLRIIKLAPRKSDSAEMAILEWVNLQTVKSKEGKSDKKKKKTKDAEKGKSKSRKKNTSKSNS